ncbi:ribosomal protein S18 acetylase RimI-like enzyme [Flavobacterium nitrogenifigens]|uniref:Ribosomal protein S18 acetylase RimI-like enzyme n=2 Tax=Flavobacterium TaxID=237 RepID=A0A7W7N8T6_9FLAO|nr:MULTISPECIES: GNAT family N-acetyltransferase [Flavobacterium]MBB4802774.1 ribosomal protein S18 acetylase RimI-like enzyme [Flavobacterium nitrogenifigens]MBB6387732.1 ribosomal protein S18 acetylase RimI-like enzyme [Flavobacterium notoginsengisoli]
MNIRKADKSDSKYIAPILLLAMEDIIYKFLNKKDYASAKDFLEYFIERENNQYSYQNCFVAEESDEIIGAVNIYNGADIETLRNPIIEFVRKNHNPEFDPEFETKEGEFYIDSLGVNPNHQGKGIGSKLLVFLINEYVHQNKQTLGLLVEEDNPLAKNLYLKLGFKIVGEKTLVGKKLEHLQIGPE